MEKNIKITKYEIDVGNTSHITNCYFITDSAKNLVIIDPADNANYIIQKINENGLSPVAIILTHCHSDHICALSSLMEKFPDVNVYVEKSDIEGLNNSAINCEDIVKVKVPKIDEKKLDPVFDMQNLEIGEMNFFILHTPGHTKGSIVLYEKESNTLFTGDTIFSNTYGRTDLISGSHDDMRKSLDKVFDIFQNVKCMPGHGDEFILSDVKKKINLLFAFKG